MATDVPSAPGCSRRQGCLTELAVCVALYFGVFFLIGFERRAIEVDIRSGRVQYSRWVTAIRVERRVEDTAVSRALGYDAAPPEPDWRPAITHSGGRSPSPHYRYHGASSQLGSFGRLHERGCLTPKAERAAARRLLDLWQTTGDDYEAGLYLGALESACFMAGERRRLVGVERLPRKEGEGWDIDWDAL